MTKLGFFLLIVSVLATTIGGCATNRVANDFGTSHRLSIMEQTIDPQAGKNMAAVEGLDERTGQKIMERYRKGFEKEAAVAPVINVGSSCSK